MSIPISFSVDIVSKRELVLDAIVEMLKLLREKENLFANFPIGATIQDGGKRKRSSSSSKTIVVDLCDVS